MCYPEYLWANDLFNGPEAKRIIKAPAGVDFVGLGSSVSTEFFGAGDLSVYLVLPAELLLTSRT